MGTTECFEAEGYCMTTDKDGWVTYTDIPIKNTAKSGSKVTPQTTTPKSVTTSPTLAHTTVASSSNYLSVFSLLEASKKPQNTENQALNNQAKPTSKHTTTASKTKENFWTTYQNHIIAVVVGIVLIVLVLKFK